MLGYRVFQTELQTKKRVNFSKMFDPIQKYSMSKKTLDFGQTHRLSSKNTKIKSTKSHRCYTTLQTQPVTNANNSMVRESPVAGVAADAKKGVKSKGKKAEFFGNEKESALEEVRKQQSGRKVEERREGRVVGGAKNPVKSVSKQFKCEMKELSSSNDSLENNAVADQVRVGTLNSKFITQLSKKGLAGKVSSLRAKGHPHGSLANTNAS